MSIASQAVRTTNVTGAAANHQLRTAAAAKCKILETSAVQVTGTAGSYGWGRPAALAGTPATSTLFQRDDSTDPASVTNIDLTWATTPTAPTVYHRRWNSAATIGVGVIWTFPRGIVIPVSSGFVCFNIATPVALDINYSIDE
jgi:hypothetical protein